MDWREDILGEGWEQTDLRARDGGVSTLVRKAPAFDGETGSPGPAILYVHGYVDYFYQKHLAEPLEEAGYRFYGIDLRGCGRSIGKPGQEADPHYSSDFSQYAKDLDAAARMLARLGHREVIVVGHSMGGLITSLWLSHRPALTEGKHPELRVRGLVLNSPALNIGEPLFMRLAASGPVSWLASLFPLLPVSRLSEPWGRAISQAWDYDLELKPVRAWPVRAGWLRAVRRSQAQVRRGLSINCPILLATSDRSISGRRDRPDLLRADAVLNVKHMWGLADHLGPDVEIAIISGGAHDLALSEQPARREYLQILLDWVSSSMPLQK